MGRGDKKTKKGKIFKGSFGKSRPSKTVGRSKEDCHCGRKEIAAPYGASLSSSQAPV